MHTDGVKIVGQAFDWQLRQVRTSFAAIHFRYHGQDERLADSRELRLSR